MNKPNQNQNKKPTLRTKTPEQLERAKEPALYAKLNQVASMEEFEAGLQIAMNEFENMHSLGNEMPHIFQHNETSKAAVRRFGLLLFEVFNSHVEALPPIDSSSDFAE